MANSALGTAHSLDTAPRQALLVPPAHTRASHDGVLRTREERMFELRSKLTTAALESDCARLTPGADVELAHETFHTVVSGSLHGGLRVDVARKRGTCRVRLRMHDVMFELLAELSEDGTLRDARWFTFDRRATTRLSLRPGLASLSWAGEGERGLVHGEVADLTPSGTQIRLQRGSMPPERASFAAELKVGAQSVSCVAELRQVWGEDGERRAGLRLITDPNDSALADLYLAQRFSRLRRRSEVPAAELCAMLQASGYMGLRDGSAISREWLELDLPNESSCDAVYEAQDGKLLGHISATRVYTDTWLFHQLATLSGHEETVACRKELYGLVCSVPNVYSGERAHGLAYFDLNKRWHRLFFEEFTHWVGDPEEALITKLDRFERADGELPAVPRAADYHAELATRSELVLATSIARAQLPAVLADALDVSPWRLRQRALCGAAHAERYTRSREVFVLRGPRGVEAVALCELGSASLSLFDIFNMAYVFVSNARGEVSADAQRLLLARVRQYYLAHGVRNPLIVSPHGTLSAESEPGTRLVETMGAMSMTAFAMRQWENFCQVHFSHQLART